ncbi:hypothetical protein [Metapseudomonas otitidis]|uniref:Uncharacterized protein n=1 Tax=Metapseudomonas otitidis TaxID=319939 RepID=A0A679GIR2_9GAMM|nr:hypothetical protein [Pseudomonas otitidis]BCA30633.1 hypothetical protein PtoMrB4_46100 [Pseudomonas otitidis]
MGPAVQGRALSWWALKEGSDRHLRLAQAGGVEKEKGIARHGDTLLLEFQSTLDFYVQIVNRPLNCWHG